jgi:hypothetical protein
MWGIQDGWVLAAYLLCIASTVLCVLYGLATWNRGDEPQPTQKTQWVAEEKKLEEEL